VDATGAVDWVIDAAANPSVLAGVDGRSSSLQVVEHNLLGTVNLLEHCKRVRAGFVLVSTSRVYSIRPLAMLDVLVEGQRFVPHPTQSWPTGLSPRGIDERGPTSAPISLYGATKLASEALAVEYGSAFDFPVWINRCGVMAGAGQFGRADQGILAFWLNAWLRREPLRYIGFGGRGHQVRDCLHPRDLVPLLRQQIETSDTSVPRTCNASGGIGNSISLAELSDWCADRFGPRHVSGENASRQYDIPWLVLDYTLARATWGWQPQTTLHEVLDEIADHAEAHPHWLAVSSHA
jgi:CDP-paratose 2-epimerase